MPNATPQEFYRLRLDVGGGAAICWLVTDAYWTLAARKVKNTIAAGQKPLFRKIYLVFSGVP